jgi:hypothetical protein
MPLKCRLAVVLRGCWAPFAATRPQKAPGTDRCERLARLAGWSSQRMHKKTKTKTTSSTTRCCCLRQVPCWLCRPPSWPLSSSRNTIWHLPALLPPCRASPSPPAAPGKSRTAARWPARKAGPAQPARCPRSSTGTTDPCSVCTTCECLRVCYKQEWPNYYYKYTHTHTQVQRAYPSRAQDHVHGVRTDHFRGHQ